MANVDSQVKQDQQVPAENADNRARLDQAGRQDHKGPVACEASKVCLVTQATLEHRVIQVYNKKIS